jgi:hypothetical protein
VIIPSTSNADMVLKAFLFTLKERFPERGARMIEKGKFALSDVLLLRDITLRRKYLKIPNTNWNRHPKGAA